MPHLETIPTLAVTPLPAPSADNLASICRYHNDAFGHYPSADVSRMMTAHDYNWPTIRSDIDYAISNCTTCSDATPTFPITPDQLVILRDHHNHLMGHHGIDATLKLLVTPGTVRSHML
jgi:hypothetical protein